MFPAVVRISNRSKVIVPCSYTHAARIVSCAQQLQEAAVCSAVAGSSCVLSSCRKQLCAQDLLSATACMLIVTVTHTKSFSCSPCSRFLANLINEDQLSGPTPFRPNQGRSSSERCIIPSPRDLTKLKNVIDYCFSSLFAIRIPIKFIK